MCVNFLTSAAKSAKKEKLNFSHPRAQVTTSLGTFHNKGPIYNKELELLCRKVKKKLDKRKRKIYPFLFKLKTIGLLCCILSHLERDGRIFEC